MAKTGIIQWDATAANNTDVDGVAISENCPVANLNNMGRAIMARVVERLGSSVSVASASTVNLGDNEEEYVTITGTTTITSFGTPTVANKFGYWVVFSGALTLTHNGTSLILPGAGNITTTAGDVAYFKHEGSGNWRCLNYLNASGGVIADSTATSGYVLTSNGPGVAPVWQESPVPVGSFRRLAGAAQPNTVYGITLAEDLILKNSSGAARLVNIGDYGTALASITLSGISGLDTGTEANSTHYYIWVIDRTTPRSSVAITADSTTDIFTDTAHGMANGTVVLFSGGLPSGLSGTVCYYVINSATNTFQVATTPTGSAVNFTTNGSGLLVSTLPATLISASATAPTMPSGYTYKALVSWVRNDSSGNFIYNAMKNRRINFEHQNVLTAGAISIAGNYETISLSSVIPPMAVTVSGVLGRSDTAAGATYAINVSGDSSATARYWQGWGASNETTALAGFGGRGVFSDLVLATPSQIQWTASVTSAFGRIDINGFTF